MTFRPQLWTAGLVALLVSSPARAERITGTFDYQDFGTTTPIANATVEIYRHRPGQIGWSMDMIAFTNASGELDVTIPYAGNNVLTSLRIYADNPAVRVLKQDDPFQTFYQKPGWPSTELQLTTTSPASVLDFSHTFPDEWSAAHYNAAEAARIAKAYADARRDPFETDPIEKLDVQIQNNAANTYFDPISHRIRISVVNALSDRTVIHEYAHYLEQKISSFAGQATWHDGCRFLSAAPPWGLPVGNAGLAWMEGFADYFSAAVQRANPLTVQSGPYGDGTTPTSRLESPTCVTSTPEATEDFVGGALWDLVDGSNEAGDRYCSSSSLATDTIIFQIFDRELGHLGNQNPTLQLFLDAWIARGLDLPPLLGSTFATAATNLARPPTTHRYDPAAGAELAVWRPSEGNWYVLWKNGGSNLQQWGEPTDLPLPADYDGDGVTDVAIWRPRDGNWWVILSATNRVQVSQWGLPTDVPLPADYDGDGEVDFAVYRPSESVVIVKNDTCAGTRFLYVDPGTPVVGDFDGDRRADPGTFDAGTRTFRVRLSTTGSIASRTLPGTGLFVSPALADYDGDGRTDYGVFDAWSGAWTISNAATAVITAATFGGPHVLTWRQRSFATPVPHDYDGDGRADLAVFYGQEGSWQVSRSRDGLLTQGWGLPGDRPVPAR